MIFPATAGSTRWMIEPTPSFIPQDNFIPDSDASSITAPNLRLQKINSVASPATMRVFFAPFHK